MSDATPPDGLCAPADASGSRKKREGGERSTVRDYETLRNYVGRLLALDAWRVRLGIALSLGLLMLALAPGKVLPSVHVAWSVPEAQVGSAFLPSLREAAPENAVVNNAAAEKSGARAIAINEADARSADSASPAKPNPLAKGASGAGEASANAREKRAERSRTRNERKAGSKIVGAVEARGHWLEPAGQTVPVRSRALWLARCIYAETNRPKEQQLVGWVVRNRVETSFRGESTYEGVILDPGQFSPFNGESRPGGRYRAYYTWLHTAADVPGWKEALRIAVHVQSAPAAWRPFPITTRHFFFQQSMPDQEWPWWAEGKRPVRVQGEFQPPARRLRFFAGIDEDV